MRVEAFPVLQEFDTELDFTNKIRYVAVSSSSDKFEWCLELL